MGCNIPLLGMFCHNGRPVAVAGGVMAVAGMGVVVTGEVAGVMQAP